MEKIAIIDLGTNTFNLLIVSKDSNGKVLQLFQNKISVKLGEGGINKNCIAPIPFRRGIEGLRAHLLSIQEYSVNKVLAFATSAIREATNRSEFIAIVKQELNIDIKIITGDKEAELIYYGVRSAVKMSTEKSLIIDIGGGSTEFIIANKQEVFWKSSFLLGAARLLEMFNPADPIKDKEHQELIAYLSKELIPLFDAIKKYPVTELIGSSGSFDSLAEMIAYRFHTPEILENKTEYLFDLNECLMIYNSVVKSTKEERLEMKGLIEMRVDMFVISSIMVHFVITELKIKKMRLSTYSLKEGVLFEMLNL